MLNLMIESAAILLLVTCKGRAAHNVGTYRELRFLKASFRVTYYRNALNSESASEAFHCERGVARRGPQHRA